MSMQLGSSVGNENRMDSVLEKEIRYECEGKIHALESKRTEMKMKGPGYRPQMGNLAMSHVPKL